MVVPITTTYRGLPSHVEIDRGNSGLDEVSYAKCEDVKSISEQRLVGQLGAVDEEVRFQTARTALPARPVTPAPATVTDCS